MFILTTLGDLRLSGPEGAVLEGRRKPLALLAYLARRAPRPAAREELASLFWGRRGDTRARASLRQALLELRRTLGADLEGPEGVRLPDGLVSLDADLFESEIDGDEPARAVERWRGDFIPGGESLGDGPFRVWLEAERESLRRRLRWGFDALTTEAERRGDWAALADHGRLWAEFFPMEWRGYAAAARGLHLTGQRSEALALLAAAAARLGAEQEQEAPPELASLAEEIRGSQDRPAAPARGAVFTPDMVGRTEAFALLVRSWRSASDEGGAVVLVEGDEGMGKTRLATEFLRALAADGRPSVLLQARAFADEDPEDWAVARELLSPLARAPGLSGAPSEALARLATVVPAIRDVFPHLSDLPDIPLDIEAAVRRVLTDVAAEQPVLLFVDDVAAADDATRRLLLFLARRIPPGVMLLLTHDPATPDVLPTQLRGVAELVRVRLAPLDAGELESMIASMAAADPEDRRTLAETIHHVSRGNPFYAAELLAALADAGKIAPDPKGVWRIAEDVDPASLPLPEGIRETVAIRSTRLSPDALALLEAASVMPGTAAPEVLAAAAGLDLTELPAPLDELVRRRLLRPSTGRTGEYEFTHPLLHRTVREALQPVRRQALHATVAAAIRGERSSPDPAAASWHRKRAGPFAASADAGVGRRGPRRVAAGILAVLGLSFFALLPPSRDLIPTPSPPSATSVAVLPFSAPDGELAYLSTGLVDLLSLALDGPGGLRTVSPGRVLEAVRRRSAAVGPSVGTEVVEELGAALYVDGRVLPSGSGFEVHAALRGTDGRIVASSVGSAEGPEDVAAAVDAVARGILREWVTEGSTALAELGVSTTRSLPALKAYLRGTHLLRSGDAQGSLAAFQEAAAHDSAFAMAWYGMSVAAEWSAVSLDAEAAATALRLADALPERQALLVRALAARRAGDYRGAYQLLERLRQRYPNDGEAVRQAAEAHFHLGPVHESPLARAAPLWTQVLRRDPGDLTARLHLARIAALAGDTVRVKQIVPAEDPPSPDGDRRRLELQALRALATADREERKLVTDSLARSKDSTILWSLGTYSANSLGVLEIVRAMRATGAWEAQAGYSLAVVASRLLSARGMLAAADAELAALEPRPGTLVARAGLYMAPLAPLPPGEATEFRAALDSWDAVARVRRPLGDQLDLHHDIAPHLRHYLIGVLEARGGGEPDVLRARADSVERLPRPEAMDARELVADLALELRLDAALRERDVQQAMDLLRGREPIRHAPRAITYPSAFYARTRLRFLRAEVQAAGGDLRTALRQYETIGQVSVLEAPFVPPALLRRAAIHARLGEPDRAAELYRRFLVLWRDADPDLQPIVEEARKALTGLESG